MSVFQSVTPWLLAVVAGFALTGVLSGVSDGWRATRGPGVFACAGDRIQVDLSLVALALVAAAAPLPMMGVSDVTRIMAGALVLFVIIIPEQGTLIGMLAGVACNAMVPTALVVLLRWQSTPPTLMDGVAFVLLTYGGVAGWYAARAANESPADQSFTTLLAGARTATTEWRIAMTSLLNRTHSAVAKVVLSLLGVGALVALVSAAAGADAMQIVIVGLGISTLPAVVLSVVHLAVAATPYAALPTQALIALYVASAAAVRSVIRGPARTVLVLARFPRALCDSCLRMDPPLMSHYRDGVRTCSKCTAEISFQGGPGRLVAVFTDGERSDAPRVFVRRAATLVTTGSPVDVTHIRLGAGFAESEVERLAAFLLETPTSHPSKRIGVHVAVGDDQVKPYLRNLLDEHFSWTAEDPLG